MQILISYFISYADDLDGPVLQTSEYLLVFKEPGIEEHAHLSHLCCHSLGPELSSYHGLPETSSIVDPPTSPLSPPQFVDGQ